MNLEKLSETKIISPKDRVRLEQSFELLASGAYLGELTEHGLFTDKELIFMSRRCPVIKGIMEEALSIRDEIRQLRRVDAADTRAVEGVEKAVYNHRGDFIGNEQTYSDSLLALQLKANDAPKYAGSGVQVGGGFVLNVNLGIDRSKPEEKIVDAECTEKKEEAVDGKKTS